MMTFSIGSLAERTGTNVPTIRYYESVGLLPRPERRAGGHRIYDQSDVRRLTFIRRCREFGFPIEQVRKLVKLVSRPDSRCAAARDVAREHLASVQEKLAELLELERDLAAFIDDCTAACENGRIDECTLVDRLADTKGCCS
jgi:DNA-binding transcriptional MerR regulator